MVFIDKRLQPVYAVVLDCPGKDSIRLWPLPVVDPWVERRKATLYLQVGGEKGGKGAVVTCSRYVIIVSKRIDKKALIRSKFKH